MVFSQEISAYNIMSVLGAAKDIFGSSEFLERAFQNDPELIETIRESQSEPKGMKRFLRSQPVEDQDTSSPNLETILSWMKNPRHWISYDFMTTHMIDPLLTATQNLPEGHPLRGNPRIMIEVGAQAAEKHAKGLRTIGWLSGGDPGATYMICSLFNDTMNRISAMWNTEAYNGAVKINDRYNIDLRQCDCDFTRGVIEGGSSLFNGIRAFNVETHCQVTPHRIFQDLNDFFEGTYQLQQEGPELYLVAPSDTVLLGRYVQLGSRQPLVKPGKKIDKAEIRDALHPIEHEHYTLTSSSDTTSLAFLAEQDWHHNGHRVIRKGKFYACPHETYQVYYQKPGAIKRMIAFPARAVLSVTVASKFALTHTSALSEEHAAAMKHLRDKIDALEDLQIAHARLEASHIGLMRIAAEVAHGVGTHIKPLESLTGVALKVYTPEYSSALQYAQQFEFEKFPAPQGTGTLYEYILESIRHFDTRAVANRENARTEILQPLRDVLAEHLTPANYAPDRIRAAKAVIFSILDDIYRNEPLRNEILHAGIISSAAREGIAHHASNLMYLTRRTERKPEEVDLQELLHEVAISYQDMVDVQVTIPEEQAYVACNREELETSMRNLVENSRKAIDARFGSYEQGKIVLKASSEGSTWRIECQDNGRGIDPNLTIADLAEDWYSTFEHGSGLGLAIVKSVMDKYGGTIEIKNHQDPTNIELTLQKVM